MWYNGCYFRAVTGKYHCCHFNALLNGSIAYIKSYRTLLSNFHMCYTHKKQDTFALFYVVYSFKATFVCEELI